MLALVVAGTVAAFHFWPRTWWQSPEQLLPPGSPLVMSVDVRALIESPLWDSLGSEATEQRREAVQSQCGVDPLSLIDEVVVGVMGNEVSLEHVVFFVEVQLPFERVKNCVSEVLSGQGQTVEEVEINHLPALGTNGSPSRLVWLGGDWWALGAENAVTQIAQASQVRPESPGPWSELPTTDPASPLMTGDVRIRARVPAHWAESNPLEDGLAGSAARRAMGLVEGISGGLTLDDQGALRWSLLLTTQSETTSDALMLSLRAWKLAASALTSGTPMELLTRDFQLEQRPDGVSTGGSVEHAAVSELIRDWWGEAGVQP